MRCLPLSYTRWLPWIYINLASASATSRIASSILLPRGRSSRHGKCYRDSSPLGVCDEPMVQA